MTAAVLAAALYLTLGSRELWQMGERRRRLAALEAEVARLQAENDSLEKVLWRLENDLSYIEKIAREEYGMIKKGEHVYPLPLPEGD